MIIQNLKFEVIPISWSAKESLKDNQDIEQLEKIQNPLVYQIYGDHPVYGQNVLLYIGRTNYIEDRKEHHLKFKFERGLNLSIRYGKIPDEVSKNDKYLFKIEALLIASIKPAYNSSGLMNSKHLLDEPLFLIQNCDNRGSLPLECSSIWWYKKNDLI